MKLPCETLQKSFIKKFHPPLEKKINENLYTITQIEKS